MAPWESGLPAAVTMPSTVVGSRRGGLGRCQVGGHDDAGERVGGPAAQAEEVGEDLVADGANVAGAGLEVRIGELGEAGSERSRRRPARRARP